MIRFSLSCAEGHDFEGWFASTSGFESQKGEGILACPICGTHDVGKALMAPAIATSRGKEAVRLTANVAEEPDAKAVLRKIRKHLTDNATYVGDKFAEEARRIHYDEAEKRGIYGEATSDEVRSLANEGIEFHPLPVLPEAHN